MQYKELIFSKKIETLSQSVGWKSELCRRKWGVVSVVLCRWRQGVQEVPESGAESGKVVENFLAVNNRYIREKFIILPDV